MMSAAIPYGTVPHPYGCPCMGCANTFGYGQMPAEAKGSQAAILRAAGEALYVTDPHRKVELLARNLQLAKQSRLPPFIITQLEGRLAAAQRAAAMKEETEQSQREFSTGAKIITYSIAALAIVGVLYGIRRI